MILDKSLPSEWKKLSQIVGIDEVGRGCWAGPALIAAVILPDDFDYSEIKDSKKMTAKQRVKWSQIIQEKALWYHLEWVTVKRINEVNIGLSLKEAFIKVIELIPDDKIILIDGNWQPDNNNNCHSVVKGDNKHPNIAAAAILAKVTRDDLMTSLDQKYPGYDWAKNKGYGVKNHQKGLKSLGITSEHRKLFIQKWI